MSGIAWRPARADDSDFAYETKRAAFREYVERVWGWHESEQRAMHDARFGDQEFLVIEDRGERVGVMALVRDASRLTLNQLFLAPDRQGQGLGSEIMGRLLDEARSARQTVSLQVLHVNPRARAFYERLGFLPAGRSETHLQMVWRRIRSPERPDPSQPLGLDEIAELEERAMNAWPAAVVHEVDGWRLRYTDGVSRRANSVWTHRPRGDTPLEERIASAEAFYAEREADCCFHVSPASPVHELDRRLADRGYLDNGATWLQTSAVERVLEAEASPFEIGIAPSPSEAWESVAWPEVSDRRPVRRGIVERIGPAKAFALVCRDGEPASVGLGVVEQGLVGVFCMRTHPRFRRCGLAAAILRGLVEWGSEQGGRVAYLQVEVDNTAAQGVYRRAGFETRYGYHYRTRVA